MSKISSVAKLASTNQHKKNTANTEKLEENSPATESTEPKETTEKMEVSLEEKLLPKPERVFPEKDMLYHFHPFKFLEQMERMSGYMTLVGVLMFTYGLRKTMGYGILVLKDGGV